jgi:riboflavin synthase
MFTGLIADVGTVTGLERSEGGARLQVTTRLAAEIAAGDSVAVNGACLTAALADGGAFEADVMNQTLELTALGSIDPGTRVNLELAVRPGDRLGGHLVQGHVDGTGTVIGVRADGLARRLEIAPPEELRRYLVARGSVAVDGVSLTVAALGERGFEVSLVTETLERTTLADADEGSIVNLEVDVVARYVERLLSGLTEGAQQ